MKFRKGDIVSLRGTVKHNFDPYDCEKDTRVFVDIVGSHETIWIKPEDVTLVQPMFEIGDQVRWDEHGAGTIVAINDGHAWIGMESGDYCTRLLTAIERMPDTSKDDIV